MNGESGHGFGERRRQSRLQHVLSAAEMGTLEKRLVWGGNRVCVGRVRVAARMSERVCPVESGIEGEFGRVVLADGTDLESLW